MEYNTIPICIISFTLNPTIDLGFNIKFKYKKNRKHVQLRLFGNTCHDIFQLAKNIKKEIMIFDNYETIISYKTCPRMIIQSKKLKNNLLKLFVKPTKKETMTISWEIIQNYIDIYGKAPDFDKYHLIKYRRKIKNYIEHILNCNIDNTTVDELMEERNNYVKN